MMTRILGATLLFASLSFAQNDPNLLFRESFGPGPAPDYSRPKSGKGKLTPASVGTGLSGFWAEFPSSKNTTWMSIDAAGVPGWNFAGTSINPNEAPTPYQPDGMNGTAWCFNDLGAFRNVNLLAPFNSPKTRFSISADLMPRPILGHSTALGLTNSNVLEDNFETSATVWVRILAQETGVQGSGKAEFRVQGLTGASTSAIIPVDFNGFNHVVIVIDPVARQATATVNGINLGTLAIPAGTTKYIGVEGSGGVDDLNVKLVP